MKLWIARDKDGLTLFEDKPDYHDLTNIFRGEVYAYLPEDSFPEVTFENSPREIELKLVEFFTKPKSEGFLSTKTLKRIGGLKIKKS